MNRPLAVRALAQSCHGVVVVLGDSSRLPPTRTIQPVLAAISSKHRHWCYATADKAIRLSRPLRCAGRLVAVALIDGSAGVNGYRYADVFVGQ